MAGKVTKRSASGISILMNVNYDRANELADAHWGYVSEVLKKHMVSDNMIEIAGFHYKSAFVHGYKHAIEDIDEEETSGSN